MKLSVIILNYNVRFFLEQCVLSVQEALKPIDSEIIVVDNFSTDGSCSAIKKRFPEVIVIENQQNLGFPKGNNIGVSVAKGHYICILNPDTVVTENTFIEILEFADRQQNLGIIGCKLIDGTGNFLPESKRGIPTPWVAFSKIMGLYKIFPKTKIFTQYYAQHLEANQIGKVDILVGAFMLMEKQLYQAVGGFDENCFMYSDDIDLSYTVLKKGRINYYYGQTSVIHYKGESTIRNQLYRKRFQEAMQFFYKKHFGGSIVFTILMCIGSFFFSFFKKQQQKPIQKPIDAYYLVSQNNTLQTKIATVLQKKVTQILSINQNTLHSQEGLNKKNIEIILDNNTMSFSEIILFLENTKNKGFTYKILPAQSFFLIGSNSSNHKGEVIEI